MGDISWISYWGYEETDTFGGDKVGSIYLMSFYFIVTTMTSVGFGDVTPNNDMERGVVRSRDQLSQKKHQTFQRMKVETIPGK